MGPRACTESVFTQRAIALPPSPHFLSANLTPEDLRPSFRSMWDMKLRNVAEANPAQPSIDATAAFPRGGLCQAPCPSTHVHGLNKPGSDSYNRSRMPTLWWDKLRLPQVRKGLLSGELEPFSIPAPQNTHNSWTVVSFQAQVSIWRVHVYPIPNLPLCYGFQILQV